MKRAAGICAILALTGCVTSANLIGNDGKRYLMNVDSVSKRLNANIDSVYYSGSYVTNSGVGMMAGQSFGMRPTFSTGTVMMGGNSGSALLTASNGDIMECQFNYSGTTVIGRCQTKQGREFALTTN